MSHLAIAFGGSVVVLAVVGAAFGLSDAVVTSDTSALGDALVGALAFVPAVWVLIGLTAVVVGVFPRATIAAWGALAVCFVIGFFGQVLDLPTWLQDLSPFQHVPRYPAAGIDAVPLVVLLVVAFALTAAGLSGIRHRDIG